MRTGKTPHINLRYAVIAISFSLICLAFIVALAIFQIMGPQTDYDDATTRTVTVSGLRGEIYDCKGRLLVGNSTNYDLIYE